MLKRSLTIAALLTVSCFTLIPTAQAKTEMGDNNTAAKRMPPGDYQCRMGSYGFRDCQVIEEGGDTFLVIPDGLGHFLPLKAQLLGTDTANELVLHGAPTNATSLCSAEQDKQLEAACAAQPLVTQLKGKGNVWTGALPYFIVRNSYGRDGKPARDYKHGVVETIQIKAKAKPKKK